ncbi:MAG: hypothetical protein Q8P18_31515 [Pseudomonadota bacterium]|nr:hypothetical protein [Pseudomonadota bacterium]
MTIDVDPSEPGALEPGALDPAPLELGPQSRSDDPFTARMRLHQSWYRRDVLGVPHGCGPQPGSRSPYGNMLRPEEAARGLNFTSPAAFTVARARLADRRGTVEPFRLLHNLLSSQPMCFNLFGPLALDLDLATRLARASWPWVGRVTAVHVEHAPEPAAEHLADRTAFDVFLEVDDARGAPGFIGIEAKLTEPFSQKRYDTPAYRRWSEDPAGPWLPSARDALPRVEHNQLWRDHLLAVAMLGHTTSPYTHGRLVVLHHPSDPRCRAVIAGYNALVRPGHEVAAIDVAQLLSAWRTVAPDARWIEESRVRYVDLARSEPAWRSLGGRR